MIVSLSATCEGEIRLAVGQVGPYEHHRGTRRRGQNDETGDIAVDVAWRQQRAKEPANEQPGEQGHAEGLDQPIDADGHGNAAPLLGHPVQRAEIDLEQHRHDHQPDQHGDRNIDLGHGHAAERLEGRRQQPAERNTGDDAQRDPDGQITLKSAERRRHGAPAGFGDRCHGNSNFGAAPRRPIS
jgi:hypothetical protein